MRWSVKDLAAKAGVASNTVVRFENEIGAPNAATLVVLKQAFEAAGVRFTDAGGVEPPRKGDSPTSESAS
jgi:transcriptional regulator with XRE-family HTH domain